MIKDTRDNPLYSTNNTALAAYLHSEGFELLDVDTSDFPAIFNFRNDNPKLMEFVRAFQVGKAEGNIGLFFRSYRIMIAEIKDGRKRRG
jgi:hypothetical protein